MSTRLIDRYDQQYRLTDAEQWFYDTYSHDSILWAMDPTKEIVEEMIPAYLGG